MINAVNITHHYGVKPVLKDVSFSVERGEVVALMGPNGMGKSTLVSVIAGVLWPVKGFVEIDGIRRRSNEEAELAIRKKVVYLSAEPWVPHNRTGRQWMLAVGRLYAVEDDRLMPHVDRLLDVFNLNEQADSNIGSYSSGQRKKIAMCCALATEAPVMLLDEPFSGGLDPSAILALKRILQYHAQQRDCTILMATPVPELVEEIADRVAVIAQGKIVAYDKVEKLKQQTGSVTLTDAYEHLVSPGSKAKIAQYFVGVKP